MNPRLKEIEARVNARPGQKNFEPAYMYLNVQADAVWLIEKLRTARGVLEECAKIVCISNPDENSELWDIVGEARAFLAEMDKE